MIAILELETLPINPVHVVRPFVVITLKYLMGRK
jgi:hypothetical protein